MDEARISIQAGFSAISNLCNRFCDDTQQNVKLHSLRNRIHRILRNFLTLQNSCQVNSSELYEKIFSRIREDFAELNTSLCSITSAVDNSGALRGFFTSNRMEKEFEELTRKLVELERYLDTVGLMNDLKDTTIGNIAEVKNAIHISLANLPSVTPELLKRLEGIDAELANVVQILNEMRPPVEIPVHYEELESSEYGSASGSSSCQVGENSLDNVEENGLRVMAGIPERIREVSMHIVRERLPFDNPVQTLGRLDNLKKGWRLEINDILFETTKRRARKMIGDGGFSMVFKARLQVRGLNNLEMGPPVAVAAKELKIQENELLEHYPDVSREVFLLTELDHECILKCYGAFWPRTGDKNEEEEDVSSEEEYNRPVIVLELMSYHLGIGLKKAFLADLQVRHQVLGDVSEGLEYLHDRKIVHRDIKPENILLRVHEGKLFGRAKISDLGVSKKIRTRTLKNTYGSKRGTSGTVIYMPPEVLKDQSNCVTRRSWDVWSFGLLICLMSGKETSMLEVNYYNANLDAMDGTLERAALRWAASIDDYLLRLAATRCLDGEYLTRASMGEVNFILKSRGKIWRLFQRGKDLFADYLINENMVIGRRAAIYLKCDWGQGILEAGRWIAICQEHGLVGCWRDQITTYRTMLENRIDVVSAVQLAHILIRTGSLDEIEEGNKLVRDALLIAESEQEIVLFLSSILSMFYHNSEELFSDWSETEMESLQNLFESVAESKDLNEIERGFVHCGLARVHFEMKNESISKKLLQDSAILGNNGALSRLGLERLGVIRKSKKIDVTKGISCLQKASSRGSFKAHHWLAKMYWKGNFVNQNFKEAFRYAEKGANIGDSMAEFSVAKCYRLGMGVQRDLQRAEELFEKVSAKGFQFTERDTTCKDILFGEGFYSIYNWEDTFYVFTELETVLSSRLKALIQKS